MTLDDFDLDWNMSDIWLQIKGLFGGQALGQVINELLKDALPRLVLKVYHKTLTNRIIELVKVRGDAIVRDLHRDHGTPPADLPRREAVQGDKPSPSAGQIVLKHIDIDEPDHLVIDEDLIDAGSEPEVVYDLSEPDFSEYSSEESAEDDRGDSAGDSPGDGAGDTDEKYDEQQEHFAVAYNERLELLDEVRRLADALGATFTADTKLFPAGTLDNSI